MTMLSLRKFALLMLVMLTSRHECYTLSKYKLTREPTDSCQLRLQPDSSVSLSQSAPLADVAYDSIESGLKVYAGNAFNYDVTCHVNDPKMRSGDKYYVIDLVIYGSNTRVAKAWREQFNTISLLSGGNQRSLAINKNLSFYSLGQNTIVCSVTKYNSLVNKFNRLCQSTLSVQVDEKPTGVANQQPIQSLSISGSTLDDNFYNQIRNYVSRKHLSSSRTSTSSTSSSSSTIAPETTTVSNNSSAALRNFHSKTYEFLNRKYLINNVSVIKYAEPQKLDHVNEAVESKELKASSRMITIKPLTIIGIFVVIFLISIATIVYLAYSQRTSSSSSAASTTSSSSTSAHHPHEFNSTEGESADFIPSSKDHHDTSSSFNNSSTISSVYNEKAQHELQAEKLLLNSE